MSLPRPRTPAARAERRTRLLRHGWHWPQVPSKLYCRTEESGPHLRLVHHHRPDAVTYRWCRALTVARPWPPLSLRPRGRD
jgi:hypothetical protein